MARCKLTRMSLRNIRKDKQYQCIVIDFVRTGVISKAKAEELLNYTIPAGLLEGSLAAPDDDDDNNESGNESGGQGSGGESGGQELGDTIPVTIKLGKGYDDSGFVLDSEEDFEPDGENPFVVQVPKSKTWNEALDYIAAAVDTKLHEITVANSSWSHAGEQVMTNGNAPQIAVPYGITTYNEGEPTDWYFGAEAGAFSENDGTKISEYSAETLAKIGSGFEMLVVIGADEYSGWYHDSEWFENLQ